MATTDTSESNPYLSLAEASDYLGQSVKTLPRRIAAGILPAYRWDTAGNSGREGPSQ